MTLLHPLVIQISSIITTLAALATLIYHIRINHIRQKREATLKYMNDIASYYRTLTIVDDELSSHQTALASKKKTSNGIKSTIEKLADPFQIIDKDDIDVIRKDKQFEARVRDVLGRFEHLGAGVHYGVFDLKILNEMAGGFLLRFFRKWKPYLQSRIEAVNADSKIYDQLEWLINKILVMRGIQDVKEYQLKRVSLPNKTENQN